MKGALSIQQDFFKLMKKEIGSFIKGEVYLEGMRPDIEPNIPPKEDAIVIYKSGIQGQFQVGEVMVNIYIPDKNWNNKTIQDFARCKEIEDKMTSLKLTNGEYLIKLIDIPETFPQEAINQHYVNVRYKFRRKNYGSNN